MTEFDVIKRNRIRGVILKILSPRHPYGIDFVMIRRELALLGYPVDEDTLESYIQYLLDAGAVRVESRPLHGIRIATITNHGLNLLDAIAPGVDPGIDVEGL